MKIARFTRIAALGAVAAFALAGCAANEAPAGNGDSSAPADGGSSLSGTISATGASSQGSAQEAWVAAFQTANGDVTVNYNPTGSGVGRENFISGAANSNFIGSDRAFNDEEIAAGGFGACVTDDIVEVPAYISPVAIAFNLDGVDTLNLDAATIAGIFSGEIDNWNDDAIASQNEGVELPDQAITPVFRSDPSGTQETFTSYLEATAPDVWTDEASDEWPLDIGEGAQGTSGVKQAISAGAGYIGFLDASQADGLGQTAVKVGDEYVPYSADAAAALVEASPLVEGRSDHDLAFEVDAAAAPDGSYPIALVSYLIACTEYEDPEVATLVKEYIGFVTSTEGQEIAAEAAGSAPLSSGLQEQISTALEAIQVG
ncbi:phosphate ABC transporter substrate-binding protein PstS [Microbacterium marinilacus]|uniref:Phosphate-binding protein n=1 Tax=Microbacterium marinilacus TaxID=415209 RepID=A0ABP7BDL4_9MICO|nr:phosphate ABC transporter substrate-binding protein PstS [Microbacterium marinilacus]MBY0688992.1 phosphate ABC transporter substrate-binding protein PstS [Microbacterium marinilacus]